MSYTHMAVGASPENLVRLVVAVEWTPGQSDYAVTLYRDETGEVVSEYRNRWEAFETAPADSSVLDIAVYRATQHDRRKAAELFARVCGFGFTEWCSAASLPSTARAKFGGAE